MAGSSFGHILKLSTFGESHGDAIGGVLDGVPSNVEIDLEELQRFVNKRKPGQSKIVTQRKEQDKIEILSGIFEGKTLGTPIGFLVRNKDQKPKDYSHIKKVFRPSHADFTFQEKYGIRDYRGGGRSSARETVSRVIAGGIALQILKQEGVHIQAFVDQVGTIKMPVDLHSRGLLYSEDSIESNMVRCPEPTFADQMIQLIQATKKKGDSVGGCVTCTVAGLPAGIGEPVFDKLHANLGRAMLSINAVKGVEFGAGFDAVSMYGSEHNDQFNTDGSTQTNFSGGIQGGISNGMPILFRTAFKPVATILQQQTTINQDGEKVEMQGKGRHDPCVVPRAVPIVEAMTALVILDFHSLSKAN